MTRSVLRLSVAAMAAAAFVFGGSNSAQAAFAGDSYLCWQAKINKKFLDPLPKGQEETIIDQFTTPVAQQYALNANTALCAPLLPAVNDATVHYVEYSAKDLKLPAGAFISPTTVYKVTDQFSLQPYHIKKLKPKSIWVRSKKILYGWETKCASDADCALVPGAGDVCDTTHGYCADANPGTSPTGVVNPWTMLDNYMCYQPTLDNPKPNFKLPQYLSVAAEDQFGNYGHYQLKKITKLCAPANKSGETPGAETHVDHLVCYQAKPLKDVFPLPPSKGFTAAVNNSNVGVQRVNAKKVVELCVPARKSASYGILDIGSLPASGVCGTITTASGAVPGRADPLSPLADTNAVCTALNAPKDCCDGAGIGHCDYGTTIVCGGLSFGGGGFRLDPTTGAEAASAGGGTSRYSLSCTGPADTACVISGHPGSLQAGVQCSSIGCSGVTPVDGTTPLSTCAVNKLGVSSSGTLDLTTGTVNAFGSTTSSTIYMATTTSFPGVQGCPRCRVGGTATTFPEALGVGGVPGKGVCDVDSVNAGATCQVSEQDPTRAGLSADCTPIAAANAPITITTFQTTIPQSSSSPTGHFCPTQGQGGNSDCTGLGLPQACCLGLGIGTCTDFNGCFASKNDLGTQSFVPPDPTNGLCTGLSHTGFPVGAPLVPGVASGPTAYGGIACIPAVPGSGLPGLVNSAAGLPAPVVSSSRESLTVW